MSEKITIHDEFPELVEQLQQAIEVADRTVLEFGTGKWPLFREPGTLYDPEDLYIGVNIDSRQHKHLAEMIERRDLRAYALQGYLEAGTLDQLPIPENAIDRIVMSNVLGEPNSHHIMHEFKDSERVYRGHSDTQAKLTTLQEAYRLVRPGGSLVVIETITPYNRFTQYDDENIPVVELLHTAGFADVTLYNARSEGWADIVGQFVHLNDPRDADNFTLGSYLVEATKT